MSINLGLLRMWGKFLLLTIKIKIYSEEVEFGVVINNTGRRKILRNY